MPADDDEIKKAIGEMDPIKRSVMNACDAGSLPLLKVLIEGGGNVNTAGKDGYTILMNASAKGYVDIVRFLLDNGADVLIQDSNGMTALDIAKKANQKEIVSILHARENENKH